jgi:hypothetical protein
MFRTPHKQGFSDSLCRFYSSAVCSGIIGPDGVDLERASESGTTLLMHDLVPSDYASRFETTPLLVDRRAELFHTLAKPMEWK